MLTLGAVVLSYYSITFSLAQMMEETSPALAHRLAPYDGRITGRLAASVAGPGANVADRKRSDMLAREALGEDPTAVSAVSALGINAQLRGEATTARRLFAFAEHLSRRDMLTQLWAIEDAVARGEIVEALQHYNIALRVWPSLSDVLFPVLTSAVSQPKVMDAVVRMLAGKPMWSDSFINYVAAHGSDPQVSAQLLSRLSRAGGTVPEYARASVINALIVRGRLDQAWAYYTSSHPAERRRSRDPRFAANLDTPSQFDWLPADTGDVSTSLQGGTFSFAAPPSVGGHLLQQVQLLPPGSYVISGRSTGIDQSEDARPYWVLRCQNGQETGRIVLPNSAQSNGNFTGRIDVPADCPVQTLALMARPSDAAGGLTGAINWVQLAPAK